MGEDRPGAGVEGSLRALKPPPDRLYGRGRGHRLRPRQQRLLEVTLPRLPFAAEQSGDPLAAFSPRPAELWLEVGEANAPLPGNLRLWTEDARTLLRLLPDGCLDRLFLLFPDPWPKARHAKRRFVHPVLLPLLARLLRSGAEWRAASDDPTYQAWVTEVMAEQTLFDAPHPATDRPEDWPPTRYEAKALREGRAPHYWTFIRR